MNSFKVTNYTTDKYNPDSPPNKSNALLKSIQALGKKKKTNIKILSTKNADSGSQEERITEIEQQKTKLINSRKFKFMK